MREAGEKILMYTKDISKEDFLKDGILSYAIVKYIENIGEAAFKIDKEYKRKKPDIQWKGIEGIRHIFVHDYYIIDFNIVWDIAANRIELLLEDINSLILEEE